LVKPPALRWVSVSDRMCLPDGGRMPDSGRGSLHDAGWTFCPIGRRCLPDSGRTLLSGCNRFARLRSDVFARCRSEVCVRLRSDVLARLRSDVLARLRSDVLARLRSPVGLRSDGLARFRSVVLSDVRCPIPVGDIWPIQIRCVRPTPVDVDTQQGVGSHHIALGLFLFYLVPSSACLTATCCRCRQV
jgi:hypothetical protein